MNFKIYCFSCFLFLVLAGFSCKKPPVKISKNIVPLGVKYKLSIVQVGEKKIGLDSLSTPDIESINIFESKSDGKRYFSFFNKFTNSIYFYNYDSGNIEFITNLQKKGINGVGSIIGHYVVNLDSIFVLDQWRSKISLVNRVGKKINSYTLPSPDTKQTIFPVPKLSCVNAMIYKKGKIYLTGNVIGEFDHENASNRPVIIIYDINTRSVNYGLSYPDIYQNVNWGALNFRDIFSTVNEESNVFVVSFPADHYLYTYDFISKRVNKFYAGSRYFRDIRSLNRNKDFFDMDSLNHFFGSQPSYSTLIYDEYRKLYYRFAEMPIKNYNNDEKVNSIKQFSIIVLNDQMKIEGETMIPHLSHTRLSLFVTKEGLNMREYNKDDDQLTFTTYLPIYKKL